MVCNKVSINIKGLANSTDVLLLQLVCAVFVTGAEVTISTTTEGVISVEKTITNTFTDIIEEYNAITIPGCIRLLLEDVQVQDPQISSWLHVVEQTILPIIRENKQDGIFQKAVLEFHDNVLNHLSGNKALISNKVTVADLVVAVALAKAMQITKSNVDNSSYYVKSILEKLITCVPACKDELQSLVQSLSNKPATATATAATGTTTAAAAAAAATTTTDTGDNAILNLLQKHGIKYEVYDHVACMTAEELVTNVPLPSPNDETHTKNLFFKDKKHGMFLVTIATKNNVNTKELGKKLNLQGKINLRLADEKLLDQILHVKPGCVGPLTIGIKDNDTEPVTVVLDQELYNNYKYIHSHPLRNDMSVKLTPDSLKEYYIKIGIEPVLLEFDTADATAAAGKAPANRPPAAATTAKKQEQQPKTATTTTTNNKNKKQTAEKGETLLALQVKKLENFPQWYTDVITLSDMISYYDISGCYILRPWSYKIWELIQNWFNNEIEKLEVENAYFPLFVSKDRLEKEKDHVEGFAPEVAWVTKSGDGDLAKPIAIRPTSETIMYPAFSDWVQSHRDLPIKLNQWSNVVRWEFKYPTPFLRTREFLWQEGHTAHSTDKEANDMVMSALELYRQVYEDLLAVPVIPGYKTEKEKFAGGYKTTTVEAYIAGSGRAIQGATSHHLGQNFGKMFNITFQNDKGQSETVYQTSWGLTTRTIGVMVMVHGDNTGLVLPPKIAPIQIVIVPIISKKVTMDTVAPYCEDLLKKLKDVGIRTKFDNRTIYNPGWKYNHWEQKGVPIRIEIGPRDIEQSTVRVVLRYNNNKQDYPIDGIENKLQDILNDIQINMYNIAKEARDTHIVQITEWKDFVPNLEKNNLVLTPWIGGEYQDWEEYVKNKSREESLGTGEMEDERTSTSVAAKTLCIPFNQPELPTGTKCIASGKDATCWVLWGRSY